jgi:hypothetical protein
MTAVVASRGLIVISRCRRESHASRAPSPPALSGHKPFLLRVQVPVRTPEHLRSLKCASGCGTRTGPESQRRIHPRTRAITEYIENCSSAAMLGDSYAISNCKTPKRKLQFTANVNWCLAAFRSRENRCSNHCFDQNICTQANVRPGVRMLERTRSNSLEIPS